MIDVVGMLRQASSVVNPYQLLRSGKRDIHVLSMRKIDEIFSRAIRNIFEMYRPTGNPTEPGMLRKMERESKQEFDDLLSQHQQTATAQEDLAQSKRALDRELQEMRDDLAQQRALRDGRPPGEAESAMVEKRFEKLQAHLAALDQALGTLFSSKLYSYRQIQTLIRQATTARKTAALQARSEVLRMTPLFIDDAGAGKLVAKASPVKVAPTNGRRIEPFKSMKLELGRGLDVGTVKICAAARRKESGETAYNAQRNAFLDVRDGDFARKLLKYGLDYLVRGDRGYVVGDSACELANIFEKVVRRPMKEGRISPDEPDASLIVSHLVGEILGPAQQAGEICVFSVPGDPVDDGRNFIYHRSALESALVGLGYTPRPMLESHLIVFAELKEQEYTGIGLSCGGGVVNVCVAYKGVPTLAFSTSHGGDWIDGNVATALGLSAPLVCAIKEGGMDLLHPKGRVEEAIVVYYRHFIRYTLEMMKRKMEDLQNLPTFAQPIHLILGGGTSLPTGFAELFREEFDLVEFPIEVAEIRMARNPLQATAAGCLQAALAETRALQEESINVAPAALERGAIRGVPKADPEAALQLARLQSSSAALSPAFHKSDPKDGWGRNGDVQSGLQW